MILGHIILYAILTTFFTSRLVGYSLWKSFLLTLGIALIDELVQYCCIASRSGELVDIAVDMVGWMFGYVVAIGLNRRRKANR